MAEALSSGWWRCDCDVPCNCPSAIMIKRINQPDKQFCAICGTMAPQPIPKVDSSRNKQV